MSTIRSPGSRQPLGKPFGTDQCSGKNRIGHRLLLQIRWQRVRSGQHRWPSRRVDGVRTPGYHTWAESTRKWLSGRASPCQGEGRGFESRLPLQAQTASTTLVTPALRGPLFAGVVPNLGFSGPVSILCTDDNPVDVGHEATRLLNARHTERAHGTYPPGQQMIPTRLG